MNSTGTLIYFCGKMGAGKSTAAIALATERNAVLISEDEWLSQLFPNQISSFDEYLLFSNRLKPLIRTHVKNILACGVTVIMDFPANTVKQRAWFQSLATESNAKAELIFLSASDDTCLQRLAKRAKDQPFRAQFDNEVVFQQVTQYFQPPVEDEIKHIVVTIEVN